ncbi:hypothetical protein D3C71_1651620 [compost metagenome]
MVFPKFLVVVYTHKLYFDIVIFAIDICIGVVCNIMFELPKVDIAAQKIERVGKHSVQVFIV